MDLIELINSNGWIVSIITLILGAYINSLFAKRRENLMKVADKKGEFYTQYLNVLHEFNPNFMQKDTNKRFLFFKYLNVLYGSNEVIEKMAVCEKNGINNKTEQGKQELTELVIAMKKDIEKPKLANRWYKKTNNNRKLEKDIKDLLLNTAR
ncbi:hypothetical protein [Lentibacillus sp. CBA3610]|uniref:hypothetical protein n=1 Tax=Lentibacillus sp. CBA3610 TaxID=2518176 RepID=UPI001595F67A|nr:hypothetical protein [Lentibacillus sp. CBA3610]QKY70297.1 hypothetical protein Len3610_12460 [Lentibacillus sp. CBA3610]